MNAGFIGIGSMGGTLVRALATESHGNLGGRHHVCASSTVPTRSTGCFARSSPRPAWRWGVDSTSQVPNLKKAKSTSSCSPGFAVNFGKFAGVEMSPRVYVRRTMARSNLELPLARSPVLRYGLAALSVSVALGAALLLERFHFRNVADPLFLVAIAVTVWYAGIGPAIFAVVLSGLGDTYFFIEPIYSLYITRDDIPHFVIFVLFASLLTGFAAVRRRVERDLVQARDDLQIEVAERTQQASLLNLTHDPIFVRDMSDVITYWNRGAQELYGWTDKEAVGRRSQELLQTIVPTPLEDIRAELLRINRWEGELRKTKADGTQVVVASRWSLRRDEQERPVAILETNNNITERKRREDEIQGLNQELAKRSAELESINKELEAFAYSVSHDLRAPLRHMAGYTELLQERASSVVDEKSNHYMAMILDSAKRMGNLIDDLLAFSRIGRAETQKTRFNLTQLVKEAVSEVREGTEGRNIAWKIGTLPDFYGDRSMLRLVLVNLLSNAIKFTRTRPQAEIEIGSANGNGDELIVFVRDNGVGFDMKYVNKLFGVFQRLHQAHEFEGTGIGLATVQRIIHRHGGKVWAEGVVDSGATFYFSAPRPEGQLWRP
jgi:PAS domain S-box-containing protein